MGTKIQANAFLREYHSVIDLDGSTSNGMRSLYHENQILKNDENHDSFTSYDPEKVRRTILEHESIFRNQLQELHRLYGRQRELMNDIKRREINKDAVKVEKYHSRYLFSQNPREDAKRTLNPYHSSSAHSMVGCLPKSGTSSKPYPGFVDNRSVSLFPPTQEKGSLRSCEARILDSSNFPNGNYNLGIPADVCSRNMEKQIQERFSKLPVIESTSEKRNYQASYDRDNRFSLSGVQTSQHKADALTFDLYFKRNNNPGDISITNPTDGISDRLMLSRGEISANPCSNFNLVTKDFFQNSLDRMNGENSPSILGLSNERSGKEKLSDEYAEKRRSDIHSSVGDYCFGKPLAFPQLLLAEPKKEFSTCPSDVAAPVCRKRKKIFGVEISEENDDPFDVASNMSSNLDQKAGPRDENHRVFSLESSSWIANYSFMQKLELCGANSNDGKNKRSEVDLKGEILSQKRFSSCSDTKGKWLEGCSSIGVNFVEVPYQHNASDRKNYFKNVDNMNIPAEVLKKDSEHTQKFQQMIPQHELVLRDCQNNQENPKGGLPWFLRNSQVSGDLSKEKKSSYFMNLDSLQNCSQKFFGKAEIPDGTFQTSKQKKEISAPTATQDAEGGINEVNDVTSAKKILGFPISDVLQSFKDLNSGENSSKVKCSSIGGDCAEKVEMHKGLNNYISDLRHCIDLNLSLDEKDAPSAPFLPTAIVKIATTEIDLEAPAVIESETDASPGEIKSKKMDMPPEKSELPLNERDKIAAEAMIAISLSTEKNSMDNDSARELPESASTGSLKWFAEIVSSQCGDSSNVLVEVPMNRSRACDEEEESIPDGMDYFEFMTLKLEDTKEEHYHYEPFVLNNPSDDETGATQTKRSRRGRQRKDFQRDILPGLVTLSRLEVTEDFQAFEELLKAEGSTWQSGLLHRSSSRNGRGRKRWGGATTSPTVKTVLCSTQAQQPICQLEERSLRGWGKRTRRLPRQRCPNAFLSFPVKC